MHRLSFCVINKYVKSLLADHLPDKTESFSNMAMSVNNLTDSLNNALITQVLKPESSRLAWTLSFKRYKHALLPPGPLISTTWLKLIRTIIGSCLTLWPHLHTLHLFWALLWLLMNLYMNNIISQQLSSTMTDQCSASWPTSSLSQFKFISAEALASMVAASKPTKFSLDPIPADLIKELFPILTAPILAILNTSLSEGCVPLAYKPAIIKLLLKKPKSDPLVLANYWPVSTLPFLSKILERIVADQLTAHC